MCIDHAFDPDSLFRSVPNLGNSLCDTHNSDEHVLTNYEHLYSKRSFQGRKSVCIRVDHNVLEWGIRHRYHGIWSLDEWEPRPAHLQQRGVLRSFFSALLLWCTTAQAVTYLFLS